jgi:hypothetical protein
MDTGQSAIGAPMRCERPHQQDLPDPGTLCKVDDFVLVVGDKALHSGESRYNARGDRRTQAGTSPPYTSIAVDRVVLSPS